ncbi:helix-turn-helix domain-containing protein [Streptococcus merionis]|uniref:helix-turn-helix domain-containing protein n=1 Tax=Streptococcus merionis TaxID=400065 RepID=UPI0026F1C9D9|nr:helix-turn-helix transcriptional regulator [Streptococcus merionis]
MNRLKELRKEKGLTQQALADEIGVHFRTLQNWENEKAEIKSDKAQTLADYFGVSVAYLLGYSDLEYRNTLAHGMEQFPKLINVSATQPEVNLVASYRLLSIENQKRLQDIANNLVENQVYTQPKEMLAILDRYKTLYGTNEGVEHLKESVEFLLNLKR